jgi:YD repeat-containing protein
MRNANYSNTWVDLEVPGPGYDFRVARTYNSRSLFNGMFGFGWCSDFETKIKITPEGNIKLTECGGGLEITYSTKDFGQKDIDKSITQIVDKAKQSNKGQTESYFQKMKSDLKGDASYRDKMAADLGLSFSAKEGAKYFANGREVEHFVFAKSTYIRNMPDGSSMKFDMNGRLIQMFNKTASFLKFDYDGNFLKTITDNNGRKLNFKYANQKLVAINGPNNLSAEYKFINVDDLSWVKNAWGNAYVFEYDDLHNLTKSIWPDKTFIQLTYEKNKDWVTSFRDRTSCVESYKYEESKEEPKLHYSSSVKKVCGKDVTAEAKFEFYHKVRPDGVTVLSRTVTNQNGHTNDIVYHEIFGRPISIKRDNERIDFEYFQNGQVKTKITNLAKQNFEYDRATTKISKVITVFFNDKGKKLTEKKSDFKYDTKGNLTFAQNSDGQKINLTYDVKGRIATIVDQAKKLVKIQYEERFGKPSIVTRPGMGTIKITYKTNGEIDKANSPDGPQVAVQVASAFNNLLEVIAPASNEIINL